MDISIEVWILGIMDIYNKSGLYLALTGTQISMSLILTFLQFSFTGSLVKGFIITNEPSSIDLTTPMVSLFLPVCFFQDFEQVT